MVPQAPGAGEGSIAAREVSNIHAIRARRGMDIALHHGMPSPGTAMLKVLVVDDTPGRASALREALSGVRGVEVACTLESPLELLERVAEHAPDVVLIDTESPSRDVLEQLAAVSATAPRPVVIFTDDAQDSSIRAALRAGVSAYVVEGISAAPARPDDARGDRALRGRPGAARRARRRQARSSPIAR